MKLTKLDVISYEPAVVTFRLRLKSLETCDSIGKAAKSWLSGKNRKTCICEYRYCEFEVDKSGYKVVVRTEWTCDACLKSLVAHLGKIYSIIVAAELGYSSQVSKKAGIDIIEVPEKRIQTEDGEWHVVSSFRVSRKPITVGQFEQFCRDTGFESLAEREKNWETFRENQALDGLSKVAQRNASAVYLSYSDATAYANHYGQRIPSEFEWMSAAVGEWIELDLSPQEYFLRLVQPIGYNLIEVSSLEWVVAEEKSSPLVKRCGPLRFLKKGWKNDPSINRRLCEEDGYDISTRFRVVELEKPSTPVTSSGPSRRA